ncbi:MAG: hypothetical protein M1822_010119 [Bathelium mastoideum]|nr:MAG: hypothetical protein M1822_010119 [Bathelium mastoideum]
MAPATTPRGKRRENNYFDVGKQGRKTGITLKDTGIRDVDGLEPIDGIFSSPEKSPPKPSSHANETLALSQPVDMTQSSVPEPTGSVSAKRLTRNSKTRLPPPGRSPIKTSLGSSPRRPPSIGPPSRVQGNPTDVTPSPPVNRKLDYALNEVTPSIEDSPRRSLPARGVDIRKENRGIFTIESSPQVGANGLNDHSSYQEKESQGYLNGNVDDSVPIFNGDDSVEIVHGDFVIDPALIQESAAASWATSGDKNEGEQEHAGSKVISASQDQGQSSTSSVSKNPRKKPDRKTRNSTDTALNDHTSTEVLPAQDARRPRQTGRKSDHRLVTEETEAQAGAEDEIPAYLQHESSAQSPSQEQEINPIQDSPPLQSQPPSKKRGRSKKEPAKKQPPAKKQKMSKPTPSERSPKARVRAADTTEHEDPYRDSPAQPTFSRTNSRAPSAAPSAASSSKRPGPRTLTLLRQGTPVNEDGGRMTRSGRTSVKPFKWWLNEGYEYQKGKITGVTRAEEIEQPQRQNKTQRKGTKPRSARLQSIDEDEEDEDEDGRQWQGRPEEKEDEDEMDEWEENDGTLVGFVRKYDSYLEAGTREQVETGMCKLFLEFCDYKPPRFAAGD